MKRFLLLFLSLNLFSCLYFNIDNEKYTKRYVRRMSVDKLEFLNVNSVNGDIKITPWDSGYVKIKYEKYVFANNRKEAEKYLKKVKLIVEKKKEGINIKTKLPKRKNTGINIRVYLPDSSLNINISSVNGDIDFKNFNGKFSVSGTNGDIEVKNIKGDLTISTVNGEIEVEKSKIKELSIANTNGDIEIKKLSTEKVQITGTNGDIDIKDILSRETRITTTNGDVKLNISSFKESCEFYISSTNGDINLYVPYHKEVSIYAKTKNGYLNSDFPVYPKKERMEGKIKIFVTTQHGDITITEK